MARTMLDDAGLPDGYWEEAVRTAVYIRNRLSHRALGGKIPWELWTGKKAEYRHLCRRAFGSPVLYKVLGSTSMQKQLKLEKRAADGILLGYTEYGYQVLDNATKSILE